MPVSRRSFIKQSMGVLSVSFLAPRMLSGQSDPNRRILLIIDFDGGNDALNTVIPFADARYHSLRPTLAFKEAELKDEQGNSMIISDKFGLHPALRGIKQLYDAGKVAIVLGVGYRNPSGSHFFSKDIWHTANLDGRGDGWIGRYATRAFAGKPGFHGFSVAGYTPPRAFSSGSITIPNITSFGSFGVLTDSRYSANRNNKLSVLDRQHKRSFPDESYPAVITQAGSEAFRTISMIKSSLGDAGSTITYPAANPLATALKVIASVIAAIPEVSLLYTQIGSFDHHSGQIRSATDKLTGPHANYLKQFSEAIKAFYEDLAARGLADNVMTMQISEFGRRARENASRGTDHGAASTMFLIGNLVKGGLYGEQPSLSDLDEAENMKYTVDFRSVYATVLEGWLQFDHRVVLGEQFEDIGFLSK